MPNKSQKNSTDANNSVEKIVNEAINQLKKEFLNEIQEIKKSQEFVSNEYELLKSEFDKVLKVNRKLEQENLNLKKKVSDLLQTKNEEEEKIDNLEQYGRRENLEIEGIPFKENENINETIVNLAKKIGVPMCVNDISTAHRLPPKKTSQFQRLLQ